MAKWSDEFWLSMAQKYADEGSKDPSTKVGAVIVRPDKTACSWGTNGFPQGIADTEERLTNRELKLDLTIHAELNALLFSPEKVNGYTLYSTFAPCVRCAVTIIQAKIARVVFTTSDNPRWRDGQAQSVALLVEAGIEVRGIGVNPIWKLPPMKGPNMAFTFDAGSIVGTPELLAKMGKLEIYHPPRKCCGLEGDRG